MSARRQLPPPTGGDQLTELLRRRHAAAPTSPPTVTAPAADPESTGPVADAARPADAGRPATEDMVRRSWYMPRAAADALAAAVDDLHYETRRPKHEVLAALLQLAVDRKEEVRTRLTAPR